MKKFHGIRPPIPYKKKPIYTKLNYQAEWYSDWWHCHQGQSLETFQSPIIFFFNFKIFEKNNAFTFPYLWHVFLSLMIPLSWSRFFCSLVFKKYFKIKFVLSLVLSQSSLSSRMTLIDWSIRFSDSNRKYLYSTF